jgi:hypothetical protein
LDFPSLSIILALLTVESHRLSHESLVHDSIGVGKVF